MSDWAEIEANKRRLSNEIGAVVKDWGGRLPIALIYPNTYVTGMSSLGFQTVYQHFSARADLVCERIFDDGQWGDFPPPRSVETQRRLDEFAVWAFSLSFELDYLNAVNLIRRGHVAPWAEQREDGDPVLIAGGIAASANPEPLASIMDAFVIGEAEEVLDSLADALVAEIGERDRLLRRLSELPGVYVPAVHKREQPQPRVRRLWLRDLNRYPTRTVIWTPETEFGDMHLVEISRGCRRGCLFCLAGYVTRPWRERSLDVVVEAAKAGLPYRERIGLVGAAVSDYTRIDELVGRLRELGVKIAVSSLRADSVSPALLDALASSQTQTLTIAPEAGSERLRLLIGKGLAEEELMRVVRLAGERGFRTLKLYFMLGLPTETEEDVGALIALVERIAAVFPRRVSVNLSPFVPKAHTPFQWEAAPDVRTVQRRLKLVEKALCARRVHVHAESPAWAQVQAILARGDARLAGVLVAMSRPTLAEWKAQLCAAGLDEQEFTRARDLNEALPWDVIDSGIRPAFLKEVSPRGAAERKRLACIGSHCKVCGVCE